jgi:recombination protein RecR
MAVFLSPLLDQLITHLQYLPGIGPKSGQRLALHLLSRDREGGKALAKSLLHCMEAVRYCKRCQNFTEESLCQICQNPHRDARLLCILGSPLDLLAIEQAQSYNGYYFVLLGHLSPLDGIGPEHLGIPRLIARVTDEVEEVILATSPTIEGEATAHFIVETLKALNKTRSTPLKISRIAHGVPVGGELEMSNSNTLAYALNDRKYVHA